MKRFLVVPVVALFLCMSCGGDDCPSCGSGGSSGSPPVISNLQCSPTSAQIGAGNGAINMDCSVFFRDQDGDMETMVFGYVDGCGQDPGPVDIDVSAQAGVLQEGTIQIQNLIVQTTCTAGTYTYAFEGVDREGNESNTLTLPFVLVEPVL